MATALWCTFHPTVSFLAASETRDLSLFELKLVKAPVDTLCMAQVSNRATRWPQSAKTPRISTFQCLMIAHPSVTSHTRVWRVRTGVRKEKTRKHNRGARWNHRSGLARALLWWHRFSVVEMVAAKKVQRIRVRIVRDRLVSSLQWWHQYACERASKVFRDYQY